MSIRSKAVLKSQFSPKPSFAPMQNRLLQRSSADHAGPAIASPIVHEVLRSSGLLLDSATRTFIEPRFGHDFSRMRVHTDVPKTIRTKLIIGQPNDRYEQEADRVADEVMRMPEPQVQRQVEPEEGEEEIIQTKPLSEQITPVVQRQGEEEDDENEEKHMQTKLHSSEHPILQRQEEEPEEEVVELIQPKLAIYTEYSIQRQVEEEEEPLQTKEIPGRIPEVTPNLEARINTMRGGGQPLPESVRAFFEPHFGVDFSKVRVHTNTTAQESAKAIQAKAFTVGNNIIFGQGYYAPGTYIGRKLFGHELTHVVQQRSATTISTTPTTSFTDQIISRYPRSYAQAHLGDVRGGGPYPHLRLRGLDVDREIAYRIESALTIHDQISADITRISGNGWICEMTETSWGATGIRDMRLVYIDDELRTVRRAWRVQNDTVTELSEPGIDEAYQLISQDSHELAGERARVLTTPDPDQLRDVFDMTSDRGWHHIFPQSTIPEGGIEYSTGRANRLRLDQTISQRPSLGGEHYTPDRVAIVNNANISALRELVINAINRRLDSIHTEEALADRGPMILWHTRGTSNWGWYYAVGGRGAQRNYPAGQRHRAFLRGLTPNDLGLQGGDLVRWQVYRYLEVEGDTSAINAYDNQYVTIGSGFGARYGRAGQIYNFMPPHFHERLYMHGIFVNPDNTFTILDLNRGVIEHGDNALRILQVDERRLGLLVHEAQSERDITHGGETREQRLWMVRAQMIEATREIPDSMLLWRPIALLNFVVRCHHWQPSTIPWSYLGPMPRSLNVIATRVRNRIWVRHGRPTSGSYSFADIESRMRGWARAARAGTIAFGHPPSAQQTGSQPLQPKLKVGPPGDRYEQEADRVADEVVQMPEPSVQRKVELEEEERKEMLHTRSLTHQITPLVQRQIESEEEEQIQTKQNSRQTAYIDSNLEVQIQSLRGGGQPLAQSARNFFESRFGYDFSHVRIYDDTRTAELAQALNAQAFTTDQNIFIRPGEYVPETVDGRRLLAHELVHVVQQTRPPALESHEQFRSTPAERITPLMYSTEKNIVQRSGQCSPQICQPNPLDVRQPPPTSSSMAIDLDGFGVLQSSGYSMNFANILYRHLTTGTAIGIQYFQFLGSEYPMVGFCIPYERKLWNNTFLEDILQGCYGYQRSSLRHRDMRMISATVFSNALSQLEIFDEADRSTPLTRATLSSKPHGTNLTGPPIKGILLLMATDRFLSSLSMTAGAVSSMTVPSSTRGTTPSADIIEWSATPTPTPTRATSHSVSIGGATHQVIGDPNRFDDLIVYWTNHFNEIFQPLDSRGLPNPLNPDLVKAMIYSESRFNPAAGFSVTPQSVYLGLMQVGSTERLSAGDVPAGITGIIEANFADASVQIATGIRILFEKYRRVRDWELAIERYNSRAGYRGHVMRIYSIMRRP